MVTACTNAAVEDSQKLQQDAFGGLMKSEVNTLEDNPLMGIMDFANALKENSSINETAAYETSFITPGWSKDIADLGDKYRKVEIRHDTAAHAILDTQKSRIPGLRNTMQDKANPTRVHKQ
jgi:hypothetical protein